MLQRKPLIVVLEEDEGRGGLSESEVRACFDDEKWDALLSTVKNRLGATGGPGTLRDRIESQWASKWGQPDLRAPSGKEMQTALFTSPPIIWFRLADLQDVSMRLIAERLIVSDGGANSMPDYADDYRQLTYMKGEISQLFRDKDPQALQLKGSFPIYCSSFNRGAQEFVTEELTVVAGIHTGIRVVGPNEPFKLVLLYLDSTTWEHPEVYSQLATELEVMIVRQIPWLLVHEMMPKLRKREMNSRSQPVFQELLDVMPKKLLELGLYNQIAIYFLASTSISHLLEADSRPFPESFQPRCLARAFLHVLMGANDSQTVRDDEGSTVRLASELITSILREDLRSTSPTQAALSARFVSMLRDVRRREQNDAACTPRCALTQRYTPSRC